MNFDCCAGRNWTSDLQLMRLTSYQLLYRAMSFSILIYKNYAKLTNFCKNCCEWRNRTPSSPLWWSLLVKLLPGFMSEIVCLLFYRATITLTRNIIPHYRWRISHATLPISSNYELDNGLVASARFIMYTHLGAGSWIWTSDPRVKSQRQLLYISVSGNLHTLLYLAELYRLICRGRRNRTSANGSQSIKHSAVSFQFWTH